MTIKIITEPSVFVLSRQEIDQAELNRFLSMCGDGADNWTTDAPSDAEAVVEVAGRACYMSFKKPRPGGNKAYIDHILESGHGSVCEHAVWTLIITGVSRSLSHELIRHRHISPSQLSQRFVDESECAFVVPPALMDEVGDALHYLKCKGDDFNIATMHILEDEVPIGTKAGFEWLKAMNWSLHSYESTSDYLVEKFSPKSPTFAPGNFCQTWAIADFQAAKTAARKRAREAARSVLPNCVETRLCLTGNARAWIGLLAQRGTIHADAEIRRLSIAILGVLTAEAPNLFGHMVVVREDGVDVIKTPYPKV